MILIAGILAVSTAITTSNPSSICNMCPKYETPVTLDIDLDIKADFVGNPIVVKGGTMNAAARAAAPVLWQYTQRTGNEACALICANPDTLEWIVPVTSSRSAMMCLAQSKNCPPGSFSSGVSIHSHSGAWMLPVSKNDAIIWPDLKKAALAPNGNPYQFSDADFVEEESYLVMPDQGVLYQKNKSVENIGPFFAGHQAGHRVSHQEVMRQEKISQE